MLNTSFLLGMVAGAGLFAILLIMYLVVVSRMDADVYIPTLTESVEVICKAEPMPLGTTPPAQERRSYRRRTDI